MPRALLNITVSFYCILGMFFIASLKGKAFAEALQGTRALGSLQRQYPEIEKAMNDKKWVDETIKDIVKMSNPFSNTKEVDRYNKLADFYLPVYKYIDAMLQRHRAIDTKKPLFLGISAPQVSVCGWLR